jgi:hypothetical protein
MLIFLAFQLSFLQFFLHICFMKSQLFPEITKTAKTSNGRWIRIFPNDGEGYHLYDALEEAWIGRILVDADDNWIYDGEALAVEEQEELAGHITGNRKEMDELLSMLNNR